MAKKIKKLKITNSQLMWLSILLLIMIVEAAYILMFERQNQVDAQNLQKLELQVAP